MTIMTTNNQRQQTPISKNYNYKETFDRYDINKDGVLDALEIRSIIDDFLKRTRDEDNQTSLNMKGSNDTNNNNCNTNLPFSKLQVTPTTDEIIAVFSKNHSNGNNIRSNLHLNSNLSTKSTKALQNEIVNFTFDDFLELINIVNSEDCKLFTQFNYFDKDGNGKISLKELEKGLKKLKLKYSKKTIKSMIDVADVDGDGCVDFEEFKAVMLSV